MIRPYNSWKPEQFLDDKTVSVTEKVYLSWLLHHQRQISRTVGDSSDKCEHGCLKYLSDRKNPRSGNCKNWDRQDSKLTFAPFNTIARFSNDCAFLVMINTCFSNIPHFSNNCMF